MSILVYKQGEEALNWYALIYGSLDVQVSHTGKRKVRDVVYLEMFLIFFFFSPGRGKCVHSVLGHCLRRVRSHRWLPLGVCHLERAVHVVARCQARLSGYLGDVGPLYGGHCHAIVRTEQCR